jgi:hypothetical protein
MQCLLAVVSEHRFGSIIWVDKTQKMESTRCSETSAHKHYALGNCLKTIIYYSDHDESLKSRI